MDIAWNGSTSRTFSKMNHNHVVASNRMSNVKWLCDLAYNVIQSYQSHFHNKKNWPQTIDLLPVLVNIRQWYIIHIMSVHNIIKYAVLRWQFPYSRSLPSFRNMRMKAKHTHTCWIKSFDYYYWHIHFPFPIDTIYNTKIQQFYAKPTYTLLLSLILFSSCLTKRHRPQQRHWQQTKTISPKWKWMNEI